MFYISRIFCFFHRLRPKFRHKMICAGGFTLLELLIALGIFATCAVTFLSAAGNQLIMIGEQEKQMQAVLLARNKMTELEAEINADIARNKFPADVEQVGKFEEPFEDYKWEHKISKVELPVVGGGEQSGFVQRFIKNILDDMSKKVRLQTLTVFWDDEDLAENESRQEITISTHIVNLK